MAPAPLKGGKQGDRLAFISYFKNEYKLQTKDTAEPVKEIEQEVQAASEGQVDFQPDVVHSVVPENKRRKRLFEGLYLEGRPPINVGVTSSGDFFGGSAVGLSDVLGDHNFTFTALSIREFRTYEGTYINLAKRFHYGIEAFDTTTFFYSSPYGLQTGFFRQGAIATQRYTGAQLIGQYPFSKFLRLDVSAGVLKLKEQFENADAQAAVCGQAVLLGIPCFLNNGPPASPSSGPWRARPGAWSWATRRPSGARSRAGPWTRTLGSTCGWARPRPCSACACAATTRAAPTPATSTSAATWSCGATPT